MLAIGEDPNCSQKFLVGNIDVLVDNCRVKEVAVKLFYTSRLLGTLEEVVFLQKVEKLEDKLMNYWHFLGIF